MLSQWGNRPLAGTLYDWKNVFWPQAEINLKLRQPISHVGICIYHNIHTFPFNHVAVSTYFHRCILCWDWWLGQKVNMQQIWPTVVQGNLKALFSIATTPRYWGKHYSFLWITPLTLGPYLIKLSVKQGGMKYHFLKYLIWLRGTFIE